MPQPEVVCEALGYMWSLMEKLLNRSGGDMRLMEHLCRVPRYALRNAKKEAHGLVPLLLPWLPYWFSATHHCSFLYVASELIKVFGDDPEYSTRLGMSRTHLAHSLFARFLFLPFVSLFASSGLSLPNSRILRCRTLSTVPCLVLKISFLPSALEAMRRSR